MKITPGETETESSYRKEEEEEEEDDYDYYHGNKKRSWISNKLRSLFLFFSVSMTMISLLTVIISVVWLIVFLIVSGEFIKQVRSNGFNRLERAVKSLYQEQALVARTITAAQDEEIFSRNQSYNSIKRLCERAILWNRDSFKAGSQIFYANDDRVVGVKRSNDVSANRMELFYQWPTADYKYQLPEPTNPAFSLNYVYYDSFEPENITIQEKPYRSIPFVPLLTQLKGIWNSLDTSGVIKEFWTPARLLGCTTEGQVCNFIQPYQTSLFSEAEKGYFSVYIQTSYVSEILKNITYDGETALVVDRNTGNVLGSSLKHITQHYWWNETEQTNSLIHADYYPDELIKNLLLSLRMEFGGTYEGIKSNETASTSIYNGVSKYLVDARLYEEPGMNLIIISTVPEWHFIGTTTTIGIVLSCISVVALILSLLLGLCASCIIYRPLKSFLRDLRGITDGLDLESITFDSRPFFTEFDELQSSFQYLVNKLKLYRTFLPDHILKQVDLVEDDDIHEATGKSTKITDTISVASSGSIRTGYSSQQHSFSSYDSFLHDENRRLMGLGISSDKASFIAIKLMYHQQNPALHVRILSELLNRIITIGNNRQANLEQFNKDFILLGFNTVKKVKNHVPSACIIALSIKQILGEFSKDLSFGIGLSTGNTYMGTIGSKTKRTWACMGTAVEHAVELSEHACQLNLDCLFDEHIKEAIKIEEFQYRLVDMISESKMNVHDIFQLVSKVIKKDDEWIYELKNMKSSTWTLKYAKAINYMLADELHEAKNFIDEFVSEQPHDLVGKRVQEIIMYLIDNGIDWSAYVNAIHEKYIMNVGRSYYSIFSSKLERTSIDE